MSDVYLEEEYIVISLPATAVEAEITAKVWLDGEIKTVIKTMNMKEIREGFKEAEEGYIPSDATFAITDKGLQELERLMNE